MNFIPDNRYPSLMAQFEERGFALIRMDAALAGAIDQSFALGKQFFAQGPEIKHRHVLKSFVEGYREMGPEYAKTPDRPDLTESFSIWRKNRDRPELASWAASCPLHGQMHATFDLMANLTRDLFATMVEHWAPGAPDLRFRDGTWLQLNHYEPARFERELLQDPHEDMHLITLIRADAPGLEIEVDGTFIPAEMAENELLVMPGSVLTLMTGNQVKPLYHQVRNNRRSDPRSAIMFFVNPEIDQVLKPWVSNDTNAGIDIVAYAAEGPSNFGLPKVTDGLAGKAAN